MAATETGTWSRRACLFLSRGEVRRLRDTPGAASFFPSWHCSSGLYRRCPVSWCSVFRGKQVCSGAKVCFRPFPVQIALGVKLRQSFGEMGGGRDDKLVLIRIPVFFYCLVVEVNHSLCLSVFFLSVPSLFSEQFGNTILLLGRWWLNLADR